MSSRATRVDGLGSVTVLMTMVSKSIRKQARATLPTTSANLKPVTYSASLLALTSIFPVSLSSEPNTDVSSGGSIPDLGSAE